MDPFQTFVKGELDAQDKLNANFNQAKLAIEAAAESGGGGPVFDPTNIYRMVFEGTATLLATDWTATEDGRFQQHITRAGILTTMDANVTVDDADWEKISQNGAKTVCVEDAIRVITAEEPTEDVGVSYEAWEVMANG